MYTSTRDGQNGQHAPSHFGKPTTISVILNSLTCGIIPKDYKLPPPPPVPKGPARPSPPPEHLRPGPRRTIYPDLPLREKEQHQIPKRMRQQPQTSHRRPPIPTIFLTPPPEDGWI
ncbi:hypothetical protein PpBr36_04811 [Pyricularia pennisetigena]|uniref:hypothetical protein n=1 Tax=Pyricularia pennisetigena TaxID=1578925 RepID=UPI00114FEF57|nr:hypothetical protein PpBr36_04811 [Pyricularia pennisetigena]TLS27656.1 hypothetical protein PpBr36_04811 [Pyricularia pennisetigena]